ncbi:DUF2490 domain-containing protein [Flagellimonas nanhaiensis]|uniref:DUF2490 domain-containing protein n=1 Tax=Flagellimonas nanhaiensis TaxID=2292706 RepID=A0A371JPX4_9FLAO|nr:DUF2490 domain-containing protein [Allomuricauda nanhaiensis]RDY59531.1 DUF2490 domain-containing protein [Allomuricauda nanhaiensis]
MTISFTNWWRAVLFALLPLTCISQENLTVYWQPQLAINYPVSKTYSHNFTVGHRAYLFDQDDIQIRGRQIDFIHFSKLDLRDNQSIALGIQYRTRDLFGKQPNELRLTQQYNTTKQPLVVRYGHRFRTEQRFIEKLTIHRFRYRFAIDFPLKGEKLNLGEPFLVASLENLLSLGKGQNPQYDNRLNGQVGWKFDKGFKILFGIEYRLEDYTSQRPENVLFFLSTAQLGF